MESLKLLRLAHNLTQQELADILNIHRVTYNGYEQGKFEPSFEILKKLSKYFNVSIDFLLDNKLSKDVPREVLINEIIALNKANVELAISYCRGLHDSENKEKKN